jgi:Cu(I)/Ag(I) efflux system membrane fusion protein
MNTRRIKTGFLVVTVVAIAAASGYWLALHKAGSSDTRTVAASNTNASMPDKDKVLYWYDPMVLDQHFDKPGKSPFMDMQLKPKYADESSGEATVRIDPGMKQNLGIRLATVERGSFAQPIEAAANVVFDGRKVAVVQARSNGFVERVYARAPGDVIARGAPIVDLLVPEWSGAQTEFLAMLKIGDKDLAAAARERLKLLGMPADLIARIEKTGKPDPVVTISIPVGGVIQNLDVRIGMTVAAGMTLAKVNGLDTVWLEAAIPEAQSGLVNVGKPMEARLAAYPGEVFKGNVIAVLPETNPDNRTLRVRVELPNPGGRLKPGMFAQVRLDAGKSKPVLIVPSEAVIPTGMRNIVIVALDDGRFQPVEVETGHEADGKTVILKGLNEGQRVVASGQFLIDSEANLNGALARLGGNASSTSGTKNTGTMLNEGTGKIESISHDEITLSHGPIKSMGWGAMTMTFKLAKPEMSASLQQGDTVNFDFRQDNDGYVIEKLEKTGGGK